MSSISDTCIEWCGSRRDGTLHYTPCMIQAESGQNNPNGNHVDNIEESNFQLGFVRKMFQNIFRNNYKETNMSNPKKTIQINGEKPCCISFNSQINSETSSALMAVMSNAVNEGHDEIHFMLNTPGGTVADGIATYNFIRSLPAQVIAYNMGTVDSIGNVLYQVGEKRICAKASSFMFHGVGFDVNNTRFELKQLNEKVQNIKNDQDKISKIMVKHTRLNMRDVNDLFLEMAFLKADEAVDRGIADEVRDIHLPSGLPIIHLVFQG